MRFLSKVIIAFLLIGFSSAQAQEKEKPSHFVLAQYLMQQGMYERAVAFLDTALTDGEDKIQVYEMRGLCNLYSENFEDAERDFSILISLDTTYADAYNNRALARVNLGKSYDALYDASVAIELDSNFAEAYLNRGSILREMGDIEQAEQDLLKVTDLTPDNPSAYYLLGEIYQMNDSLELAAEYFEKSLLHGMNSIRINYTLANVQFKLGHFQKAIYNYSIVIDADPEDLESRNNRAIAYEQLGQADKAKADREFIRIKGLELYPPYDSLKYTTFEPTTKELTIELPDTWSLYEAVDSNLTDVIITNEPIDQTNGYFQVGVRFTINKNMEKLTGVKDRNELLSLWDQTATGQQASYYHYKMYSKKQFRKYPYTGVQNHVTVQYTSTSPVLSMYEYVLAKEDVLVVGSFQCGAKEFNYYKEIFDKAISSLILP
jgi:tetratricopeptide (TPR) repeat protein